MNTLQIGTQRLSTPQNEQETNVSRQRGYNYLDTRSHSTLNTLGLIETTSLGLRSS